MLQLVIYHNEVCSKSNKALAWLQQHNISHSVRNFISEPLSREELKQLLDELGMKASDLVRKNESLYQERSSEKEISEAQWLDILLIHPELIERPLVSNGIKAIIARPPEKIQSLL